MPSTSHEGHWAEAVARAHLESVGYEHLVSNYRLRGAELDLVMRDGGVVVAVEVKQRRSVRFGHPAEMLDGRQLARLLRATRHFVTTRGYPPDQPVRLDLVTLVGDARSHNLEHLTDVGFGGRESRR